MEKKIKKLLVILSVIVMSFIVLPNTGVSAASKAKLNKKSATIYVGKTVTLKVKNNKKKVKWISSNKKIATVSKRGKVKGKKAGKVTITAKVGGKKYKCRVTVKKKKATTVTVKDKIKNACIKYGTVSEDMSGKYYYLSRLIISDDKKYEYYTSVQYYTATNKVRISVLIDDTYSSEDYCTTFDVDNVKDATCKIWYSDSHDNYGKGVVYKELIHQNNAVDFVVTDMDVDVQIVEELATSSVAMGLFNFDYIMGTYSVGVSSGDLGFTTLYSRYN
ncbi:Ig-like domain-containing protein [Eubacterium sp. AF15-50]|uniref:Ig-like domain-containing protein n=1 Tax=Eubacterium sp. AF15-50 TaxID=2293103 RepID=UPI0026738ED8|nr:Ig-like domain-containing protein [Eubacterium sp. AF15-50]